ncbi:hypothetical protein H9623_19040 [Oerskovia sp. Sa1BUA8]|uniref:Uncharacterized protein n=1 Tax=Oerskovia douganii TaxID=2762210 RepID=A0A9D5UDI8_9CELL|nr:hypothetical protein [Oerskovia douganii]MBE7702389.1 hypothetical protein [Oerskovia douganii]
MSAPPERSQVGHPWAVAVRSWWLWAAAVPALAMSPMLFLTTLVGGGLLVVAAGALVRVHRDVVIALAIGGGLVIGSLPYALLALSRLLGLR